MDDKFSDRLIEFRDTTGLSAAKFAEKCGVSKSAQSTYESGHRHPDTRYLQFVSEIGGDIVYLITGNKPVSKIEGIEEKLREKFNETIFVAAQLNWLKLDENANFDDLATLFIAYMKDKTLADVLGEKED